MTHYLHALPDEVVNRATGLLSLLGGDEALTGMRIQGMNMNGTKPRGKVTHHPEGSLFQGLQLKVLDHSLAEPDHGDLRALTVILRCKK